MLRHHILLGCVALSLTLAAPAARANLVSNGGFETTTHGPGQFDNNTVATGWSSNGYNFIFAAGTADTTGSSGQYGAVSLWGPNNGSANGLPAASPDGGNYVGADGAFSVGAITQTVFGLTVGSKYALSFDWAGAQQSGFNGATTEQWQVTFGNQSQSTEIVAIPSHGFSGWMSKTFIYTASNTSQLLSFLAIGTPSGEPPFSLLDGVSLDAVAAPEPATLSILGLGLAAIAGLRRRAKSAV